MLWISLMNNNGEWYPDIIKSNVTELYFGWCIKTYIINIAIIYDNS